MRTIGDRVPHLLAIAMVGEDHRLAVHLDVRLAPQLAGLQVPVGVALRLKTEREMSLASLAH